jgi:hypothetical protein
LFRYFRLDFFSRVQRINVDGVAKVAEQILIILALAAET